MCIRENGTIQKEKPKEYYEVVRTGNNIAHASGAIRVSTDSINNTITVGTDSINNTITVGIDSRLFDASFKYVRSMDAITLLCLDDAIRLHRMLDGAIKTLQENNMNKLMEETECSKKQ
ncbi:MAG: hypothetical protein PHD63_05745 [Candidatus Marinimicrobia bacterium]|jgi:hypothetical protein|nr:hypothetical protein [Candidatus Neomarinimicrobiota bacterium]MDD3967051.1 hypothetical protein [Candidatus Neomarinimicrobiota bacterium]